MSFRRIIGLAIFIVGIALLVFGISATGKVGEKVMEGVTGRYTETTMWYIIGGVVLIVIGGGIGFSGRRK